MCLSTAYANEVQPAAVLMKNVMSLECRDGVVILTDLMDRTLEVPGTLEQANLVDGFVVIRQA